MKEVVSGNEAVALGVMLSGVQVIAAYPITPQSSVVEKIIGLCDSGKLEAEFINVESEHSAMACLIGAASSGVRTFTATSSQGLALMHELLHWASGARLPIVMVNVNRAMGAPWTIWCDQSDSLAQRDTGWMQFYCENNQEIIDSVIQAYKISESISIPCMIMIDGFFLSHTQEPVEIPDIKKVKQFLPPYRPKYKLDLNNPHTFMGVTKPSDYFRFRHKLHKDAADAVPLIEKTGREFQKKFGRGYGIVEPFCCDDADIVLVTSSTVSGTVRSVIRELRKNSRNKIGMVRMRLFRPFPVDRIRELLLSKKKVAVIDRNISIGQTGIFFQEIKAALYGARKTPHLLNFITGIGGVDVTPECIRDIISITKKAKMSDKEVYWIGI